MGHLYPVGMIILPFLAIATFFVVLITLVSAVEKRLVWPYVPESLASPENLPPMQSYTMVAGSAATEAGMIWIGTFADGKGKLYKLRYNFFASPTGDVLALVGEGTVASVRTRSTWLYTLLPGGRGLVTVDSQSAMETDLTGMSTSLLVPGVGFYALLRAHRARTAAAGVLVPFSSTDPLGDFKTSRAARVDRLCASGYASYLDPSKTGWRYSPKGAALLSSRQYFSGLRRSVWPDRVPTAKTPAP